MIPPRSNRHVHAGSASSGRSPAKKPDSPFSSAVRASIVRIPRSAATLARSTNRPANAVAQMGCQGTLIGHCEERNDKMGILAEAGVTGRRRRKP